MMAKLLAVENITVVHAGTRTATFDIGRRILTLPIWKEMSGDLYDMLILHEISHAINSPKDPNTFRRAYTRIDSVHPKSVRRYINIVEDARIERLIKILYPGGRACFTRAYQELIDRNFFGTVNLDINNFSIIDRLNIHFKVGHEAGVKFTDEEEEKFVKPMAAALTFADVVDVAESLYSYAKLERAKRKAQEQKEEEEDDEDENDVETDERPTITNEDQDDDGETTVDPDSDGDEDEDEPDVKVDGDKSEDPAEKKESAGGKPEGKKKKSPNAVGDMPEDDSPVEAQTDEQFENKQETLRDPDAKPIRYLGVPKIKLDKILVPHAKVHDQIRRFYTRHAILGVKDNVETHVEEFARFRQENKPVVDWLMKEFELHKAADQYARTSMAKTGILDMNRLSQYKFTDDLMKRNAIVPGGKNHALELFLDWSASMIDHIVGTVHQLLNLVIFARKANIPFNVYTFGARKDHHQEGSVGIFSRQQPNNDCFEHEPNDYAFYAGFTLRQMFSSSMTAKEFNDACVNMLMLASGAARGIDPLRAGQFMEHVADCDQMYATPLNEAIVCASELIDRARRKTGAQVVNAVFLTDGDSTTNGSYINNLGTCSRFDPITNDVYLRDHVTKMEYKLSGNNAHDTAQFLAILRDRAGVNVIGFYITGDAGAQNAALQKFCPSRWALGALEQLAMRASLDTNYFVPTKEAGYTEFYILPGGNILRINTSQGRSLPGLQTNSQMVTIMTENGLRQRKQRVLLTRFIKLIS